MARLPVTVTVTVTVTVIFFLFVFSHARSPLDLTQNDLNDRDPSNTLPESDTKATTTATILLPSENPETEPITVVEWESEPTDAKPKESEEIPVVEELPESDTRGVEGVTLTRPLEVVSFRPINRHFHRMRPLRFPHRCRHHFKPVGPRFHVRDIPYGDDMIVPGEGVNFDPMEFRGGVRQIPARWVRFHHHGRPRFPYRHHDEVFAKEDVKRPHRHVEDREMEREHEEEREGGGFMKSFRKFLHHY